MNPHDLFSILAGRTHHVAPGTPVTAHDATTPGNADTLATALRAAMAAHFADTDAHGEAHGTDDLPPTVFPEPGQLATFASALGGALANHCKRGAPCHFAPCPPPNVTPADGPTETRAYRELNAIKAALNAHTASALETDE